MNYEQKVALRIKTLCEQKQISTNKLAKKGKLSPSTIRRILHADSTAKTRITTLFKICCALNITLYEFFNDDVFSE